MDVFISGAAWVTPLGAGLDEVWEAIRAGMPAPAREIAGPPGRKPGFAATIPPKLLDAAARQGRLRRSSNVSLSAATAALAALENAGINPKEGNAGRIAMVLAVSDGGVIYTRKFYDQVVREGAGSPLLFPETVYNAPASHIAALLGLDGVIYTLVGDASAGLAALRMGAELVEAGEADVCVVAGAQEIDWVLIEGYREWGFAGTGAAGRGALAAEGAAAVVLARQGQYRVEAVSDGVPVFKRRQAAESLGAALRQMPRAPGCVIGSANGTHIDAAERAAVEQAYGNVPAIFPKRSVGDAFGASALIQVVCATQWLRNGGPGPVLAPVIGLNHQAAAALIGSPGSVIS